jgi:hypothetical protein
MIDGRRRTAGVPHFSPGVSSQWSEKVLERRGGAVLNLVVQDWIKNRLKITGDPW